MSALRRQLAAPEVGCPAFGCGVPRHAPNQHGEVPAQVKPRGVAYELLAEGDGLAVAVGPSEGKGDGEAPGVGEGEGEPNG